MHSNRLRILIAAIAAIVVLAGCNTVRGVGKDIEKTGEVIQDSANKHG